MESTELLKIVHLEVIPNGQVFYYSSGGSKFETFVDCLKFDPIYQEQRYVTDKGYYQHERHEEVICFEKIPFEYLETQQQIKILVQNHQDENLIHLPFRKYGVAFALLFSRLLDEQEVMYGRKIGGLYILIKRSLDGESLVKWRLPNGTGEKEFGGDIVKAMSLFFLKKEEFDAHKTTSTEEVVL